MEWLALSIGIGLVVSLLFTEAFGLSVGGMIVPGYFAISLDQPGSVFVTIVAACLTASAVAWIDRWAILFGRRRVVITMVIGFAIAALLRCVSEQCLPVPDSAVSEDQLPLAHMMAGTSVIGFVIPGLIALWISRSGLVQTLSPLVIATALVHLTLIALGVETLA
ncbi:MAG: poly-gamma-glutamate biosynthesis protein PgsC [Planctomycetota bacterium]